MKKSAKGAHSGPKNSNWKGGVSGEQTLVRSSKLYKEWSRRVLERDDFTCQNQNCRARDGRQLSAHHIKSFSEFSELRFDIDNGTTLCQRCHVRLHNMLRVVLKLSKMSRIHN